MKLLVGQLVITALIWMGMASFYDQMNELNTWIFYLVTSWMLLLLVLVIKEWLRLKKNTKEDNDINE
ncbi:hypothetical protein [Oceanobacillus sp. 1P07AA]|uniref:hypothetical protein n=1 Tax=Oceanobacillus sp. 1P07AA TaxID=3132293 RepID=UPI0039A5D368